MYYRELTGRACIQYPNQRTMKKLLELQKAIGAIAKDSKNPFFKSNYFDINKLIQEVKPELNKLGLVLLQPLSHIEGHSAIKTLLIDTESGETIEDITPLPTNADPQKMGSVLPTTEDMLCSRYYSCKLLTMTQIRRLVKV
jgi:hypothetical protein